MSDPKDTPTPTPLSPEDENSELVGKLLDIRRLFEWETWRKYWKELLLIGLFPLYPIFGKAAWKSYEHFVQFPTSPKFQLSSPAELTGDAQMVLKRRLVDLRTIAYETGDGATGLVAFWQPDRPSSACSLSIELPEGIRLLRAPEAVRFKSGGFTFIEAWQDSQGTKIEVSVPSMPRDEGIAIYLLTTRDPNMPGEGLEQHEYLEATTTGDRLKWIW